MSNISEQSNKTALTSEDYEEIVEAVMETSRGRWFLNEFAKHNRNADTQILLDAITKLEATIPSEIRPAEDASGMRAAIAEMASEINATKLELQTIGRDGDDQSDISSATAELDAVVDATEGAASEILEAAEAVQEMAWTLREENVADAYCDALDMRATEIYTACSFQDITGQRTKKVVGLLQNLDQRISTLAKIWADPNAPKIENSKAQSDGATQKADAHLLNGPALAGEGVSQSDIDDMLDAASWNNDTQAEFSAEGITGEDISDASRDDAAEDFAAAEMNAEDMIGEDLIVKDPGEVGLAAADATENDVAVESVTIDELAAEVAPSEDIVSSPEKLPEAIASTDANPSQDVGPSQDVNEDKNTGENDDTGVAFEDLDQKDMDALFA